MHHTIIALRGDKVLLTAAGQLPDSHSVPNAIFMPDAEYFNFDGYRAGRVADTCTLPHNMVWADLRSSVLSLGEQKWLAVAKGAELLNWANNTRHCGCCGAKMHRESEISLKCTSCGREVWPQLSPCIMVLVLKEDKALLVHARTFSRPFFGLVAGFVETGESLEQCVRREVAEETGLRISDIRYRASQSWPFPAQLMIGFTARYAGGNLSFPDGELSAGDFFSLDALPQLPPPPSLARKLIDSWLAGDFAL